MTRLAALAVVPVAFLGLAGVPGPAPEPTEASERTQVVVALASPSLAYAPGTAGRIRAEQRAFRRELARRLPDATVRWQYRLVANGFAVVARRADLPRLRRLAGVRALYEGAAYGPALDETPGQIGARGLWGAGLETAGDGVKIGIIDTGLDPRHPFFDPTGYSMPQGFPRGQTRFTNAKVIVARAFPPPRSRSGGALLAFDGDQSSHGTHVAGIAAGNAVTRTSGGRIVSGVAPRAYLGNYKALSRAESGLSPIENAAELVAAIEAAVRDGMDVINLSLGEPEIEPSRNIVARALDAAAAAGVVPVVAAGNDYNDAGAGSVSSPASAARAIAVGAVEVDGNPLRAVHAGFSSVGPSTISLRLKPDVAAPGVDVLSSVPDGWSSLSGTSMAAPHVAGAAALLRQRHPAWTVAQVRSALVQTGTDALDDRGRRLAPQFQGGGLVALLAADQPLLFAAPSAVSLGLVPRDSTARGAVRLDDAGGGAGEWMVSARMLERPAGVSLTLPAAIGVPGQLAYELRTSGSARPGNVSGYVELRRGPDLRRVPFWGWVSVPLLRRHGVQPLARPGLHRSTTMGRPALVSRYRYPANPRGLDVTTELRGPERVYRFRLRRAVANFGVVITERARGARVEPRVVASLDESRLTGYAALPVAHNPYLESFREPVPVAAALSPRPGVYGIVFDSATRSGAGAFAFRFWIDDTSPPRARLLTPTVVGGDPLRIRLTDSGSGVDPDSIDVSLDGKPAQATFGRGVLGLSTAGLSAGRHRLRLRVSDYQETKNTENVAGILPNTRTLTATITVRRP